jgi:hypothetical protein
MKIDLHVHTRHSPDCKEDPEAVVRATREIGLGAVAITDHDTIKGGLEARRLAGDDLEIIVGSEVMTEKGEVIGYFLTEEIRSKDFFEVVDEIKDQGGMVSIPHPFDYIRFTSSLLPGKDMLKAVDMVEVLNSRCLLEWFNRKAQKVAHKYDLTAVAGSDAHTIRELGDAGIIVDSVEDFRKGNGVQVFGRRTPFLQLAGSKIRRMI